MGYVYRGKIRDVEPTTPPAPAVTAVPIVRKHRKFDPTICGTPAGYKQHRRLDEDACDPCKAALAAYSREYRVRVLTGVTVVKKGFSPERCGSYAGYARHKRHDVPVCTLCEVAHADYMDEYRANRKAAA